MGCGASTSGSREKEVTADKEAQYSPSSKNKKATESADAAQAGDTGTGKEDTAACSAPASNGDAGRNGAGAVRDVSSDGGLESPPSPSENDTELSEDEREQIRRIRSRRRKQFTLSSDPVSLEHYQVATFQIAEDDAYFPKAIEVVERKPVLERRRSSIRMSSPSMSLTPGNVAAASGASFDEGSGGIGSGNDEVSVTSNGSPTSPNDGGSGSGGSRPLKKKVTWNKLR